MTGAGTGTATVAIEGAHSRFVQAGGVRTHYLESGTGEPVVLLHGSGPGVSAASNWSRTIPALATRFRVLAPEMVGFGSSDRAPQLRYTMDTWVEHVTAFLDALDLPSARFVGNSLGGMVCLYLAARNPERISRMVLMGSPGLGLTMTEGLKALRAYQPSRDAMANLLRDYFAYDPAVVTNDLIDARYEASAAPGEQENYQAIHRGQVARENQPLTEDLIRRITVPALLVHGLQDRVLLPDISWNMVRALPDAELHLFPRCGHWAQIEHAETFNRIVTGFFGRELS